MVKNNRPTLVILAAGMGSRYGGLKQMDAFTPSGDTIIDFSLYDALQAGFGKFVFVIRKDFEKAFREKFDKKLEGKIDVEYVFQEIDSVPSQYVDLNRTKPWGTGHALLLARTAVKDNFAIINADDFYGREAFMVMAKSLSEKEKESYDFNMMAYQLKNTVSEHGAVARGECKVDADGFLVAVIERTHIEKIRGKLMRKNDRDEFIPIDGNTIVSMNFWGFTPRCFEFAEELFNVFLKNNRYNSKAEFFIPNVVNEFLKSKKATVEVLNSDAKWFGVTYKEDKEIVEAALIKLRLQGVYPEKLW